jgi:hypothetical protein
MCDAKGSNQQSRTQDARGITKVMNGQSDDGCLALPEPPAPEDGGWAGKGCTASLLCLLHFKLKEKDIFERLIMKR